jgi:hypothetical protein
MPAHVAQVRALLDELGLARGADVALEVATGDALAMLGVKGAGAAGAFGSVQSLCSPPLQPIHEGPLNRIFFIRSASFSCQQNSTFPCPSSGGQVDFC